MTWRYCATIRLLPTHCRIDGYRSCGGREVSPGKNVERRAIVSPLREPANGYWASLLRASSPPGLPPTALHVRSRPHFTSDFLRTSPRGDALVFSAGFPPLGSPEDFHLPFYAHAGRTLRGPLMGGAACSAAGLNRRLALNPPAGAHRSAPRIPRAARSQWVRTTGGD